MMKMKKVFLILMFLVLAVSLTSCSLFQTNKKDEINLTTPTNLSFSEGSMTLVWNEVSFATSYIIKIQHENGDTLFLESTSKSIFLGTLPVGEMFVFVKAKNTSANKESAYSLPLELAYFPAPEFKIGDYTFGGKDLVAFLQANGNDILGIYQDAILLSSNQGEVIGNQVILYSTFLDSLPEGELKLSLAYKSPKGEGTLYLPFSVKISSARAKLNAFNFTFDGENDLVVGFNLNGDKITKLTSDGEVVPISQYSIEGNSLIIKKEYLNQKTSRTFIIETSNNATFSFIVSHSKQGFEPFKSLYVFDKATFFDLFVGRKTNNSELTIFGNGITPESYGIENGEVYLSSTYLSTLKSGVYEFAVFSGGVSSSFEVKVFSTLGKIQDFKLDYDISQKDIYVTFECDCGEDEHYLTFNGKVTKCASGDILPAVNRKVSVSVVLSCETFQDSKTYVFSPPSEALEYIQKSYALDGREYDCYVESSEELSRVLTFLSLGGNGIIKDSETPEGRSELTVFFSKQYLDYVKSNDDYFQDASALVQVPYSCSFSLSGVGNVITLVAKFKHNPNELVSSGKRKENLFDVVDYLPKGNRPSSFDDFPINGALKSELITTVADLERLPKGTKPIFADASDPANVLFQKALEICKTYISTDMTDLEKVMMFYHYLTTKVTYDTNALELYNLGNRIAFATLSEARTAILNVLSANSSLDKFLSPLLEMKTADEVRSALSVTISSLSSFSAYGALVHGVAVCDGISSSMKLLCDIEGIECVEVSGIGITQTGRENHSWNKVKISGEWFIVDATWGRSSGYINHRYFMIDEKDASSTHIENSDSVGNSVVTQPATGQFDFFVWNVEPYTNSDMCVHSEKEFQNLVKTLRENGERQFEIKLDFEFGSIANVIKSLNLACKYFVFDNVVLIIL